jgi:ankyrin repeat protein
MDPEYEETEGDRVYRILTCLDFQGIQTLLETGVRLDQFNERKDDFNWPPEYPLQWACIRGRYDVVKLYLEHGYEPNSFALMSAIEHPSYYGGSHSVSIKMVQLLLDYGANPNYPINFYQNDDGSPIEYPIQQAQVFGNPEIVRLLLDYGAVPKQISLDTPVVVEECYKEVERYIPINSRRLRITA